MRRAAHRAGWRAAHRAGLRAAVFAALALAAPALGACSAKTPVAGPTDSPAASVSPSASPTVRVPQPVAKKVAYATDEGLWLYDVKTDTAARVAQGENVAFPRFYADTVISFIQDAGNGSILRLVDLASKQIRDLFTVDTGILTYDWSPDHQTVAYLTVDENGYAHLYFREVVGEGAPRAVTTLARAPGREFAVTDQLRIQWSRDGSYVLVVDTAATGTGAPVPDDQSPLQVRATDGSLAFAADAARMPTMGVWSVNRVFYEADNGLRVWTPGHTASLSAKGDANWYDPSASPEGRFVAYDTGATSLSVRVRAYDTRTGANADVTKAGFAYPLVADSRTVWAQRVQKCEPDCANPVVPGPEVDAFDTVSGKSRKLALPTLVDVGVLFAP
jgi:hypothetical protein